MICAFWELSQSLFEVITRRGIVKVAKRIGQGVTNSSARQRRPDCAHYDRIVSEGAASDDKPTDQDVVATLTRPRALMFRGGRA